MNNLRDSLQKLAGAIQAISKGVIALMPALMLGAFASIIPGAVIGVLWAIVLFIFLNTPFGHIIMARALMQLFKQ